MKKFIFILFCLFIFVSCQEDKLQNVICGAWQINNEQRIITFNDSTFNIERLFNIIERRGTYKVTNGNTAILKYNNIEHPIYYIENLYGYDRETILIKNLYNDNKIDTLYRIQIINH